jgi:DNA-3-methyladenine glycosylase II
MLLHESPGIAPGLTHLMATVPDFAGADLAKFDWLRRDADFGGMLRMILGQQVSTHAATAMANKLAVLMPQSNPKFFLTFSDAELMSVGFSRQKMRYGRVLAETLLADPDFLKRLENEDDEAAIATLVRLPGIGRWSAEIYLMFCLGRPDVWPIGDLGIVIGAQYLLGLQAKPKPEEIAALAEPWRPHRSAAALLVWHHYAKVNAARRLEQKKAAKSSAK